MRLLRTPTCAHRLGFGATVLSICLLLWSLVQRHALNHEVAVRRTAAARSRLLRERHEIRRQEAAARAPRLRLQLEIGQRSEAKRMARLREMLRALEERRHREYEARALELRARGGGFAPRTGAAEGGYWHQIAGDGTCPAEVPQWDWQLLHTATSDDPSVRDAAVRELSAQSKLAPGEIGDLARRYERVLASKEFEGILDQLHPECTGRRFASLEGDRVLRIECDGEASYSLDDGGQRHPYGGPVRVGGAETVLAFCGEELNLLSHPARREELVERAKRLDQGSGGGYGVRRPSVIVFMIDATSRAHFRRSMPKTLAALEAIAKYGAAAAGAAAGGAPPGGGGGGGGEPKGKVHLFDFHRFNVVGSGGVHWLGLLAHPPY